MSYCSRALISHAKAIIVSVLVRALDFSLLGRKHRMLVIMERCDTYWNSATHGLVEDKLIKLEQQMGKIKADFFKSTSAAAVGMFASVLGVIASYSSIVDFKPSSYNKTAGELREAREAMWRGMNSLEQLEKDLLSKSASYDEIKLRLEALEETEKLSKSELKSTLDAIGYTRSWFDWRNVLLGFFLGIFSSIVATLLMNSIPVPKKFVKNTAETTEE